MVDLSDIENILEVYSLTEIVEQNDLSEADVLLFLVEQDYLTLPDPRALDFND